MKFTKYGAKKTTIDGITFSSKLEAMFYRKMIEDKRIKIKQLQPSFILQESFIYDGAKIREIKYIADFEVDIDGDVYFVDSKGMETPDFKLKKKMWLYKFGKENRLIVAKSWKSFLEQIFQT